MIHRIRVGQLGALGWSSRSLGLDGPGLAGNGATAGQEQDIQMVSG